MQKAEVEDRSESEANLGYDVRETKKQRKAWLCTTALPPAAT